MKEGDTEMKWEDFKKEKQRVAFNNYAKTSIECPKCGKNIYQRTNVVLASYPPQHSYFCQNCGWSGTA